MGWFTRKKKEDVIRIRLSGDESLDIEKAFIQMGIMSLEQQREILKEYTWHYLCDMNIDFECTMQLVRTEALEAVKPFKDSRDIFEEILGAEYIRRDPNEEFDPRKDDEMEMKDLSEIRMGSMSICKNAGFSPVEFLPTSKDFKRRPMMDIAKRLHVIKALVYWVMVPPDLVSDNRILEFVEDNELNDYFTDEELEIINSTRNDQSSVNSIGWKFENAWPLAWYFGYKEPEITGKMMSGEQMIELLQNHTCDFDKGFGDWIAKQVSVSEDELIAKEDLFYCLHNAVRSAQLGQDTVPQGFDPIANGGVIHERRHALTWMLSDGIEWDQVNLST